MARPEFDVIVAGAGAGGAAAACYLTRAGLRVLVVERARLPRYKACGGAIPRPVLERLPFALDGVVRAAPGQVRLTFPGMTPVDLPLHDQPVVMVMRSEFDAFLLDHAGAEVLQDCDLTGVEEDDHGVRVQAGARKLHARYLVGADGAASRVAQSLGLRRDRRLCGTLEAEIPRNGGTLGAEDGSRAVFALGALPWGYAWIFPKGEFLSVGIAQLRPGRADLRSALHHEMGRQGISLEGQKLHGHPLPCYQAPAWPWWQSRAQEPIATKRCLLVGDAAGLVDPLLGEGIRYALGSARLAAEAIARDDLSGYETAIWREIGHSLATAGMTARLYYRWPKLSYRLGLSNPTTGRQFIDLLTEKTSYQGIARRMMGAAVHRFLGR